MNWASILMPLAALGAAVWAESFVPDFRLRPDDYTVLMAADVRLPEGMQPFQPGGHGKFHVTGWSRPEQVLSWEVTVPADDAYAISVLARREGDAALDLVVAGAGQSVRGTLASPPHAWTRQALDGVLTLPRGLQTITLQAQAQSGAGGFTASLFSLELVRPAVRDRLHQAALGLRADTAWLQQAGYGIVCHWTSESRPRRGPPKPYAEAVQAFDVEALASQVQETGAGVFILTASHAQMYFPAPLQALDRLLSGRTASRDLIADLAAALGRRGIRLMLYYHLGAASDPEWLRASGFWETDTRAVFANWTAIVREVGERYGETLAGWWFDDGAVSYYYRSAPWEQLTHAAKAGNPQRLVAYNPWELPSTTEFQDYCCGEGFGDPAAGGLLSVGGDGRYTAGTHHGLQACATLVTEQDWVHSRTDTDIGPPRWNAAQLAGLLREFKARRNVPLFNLEIYQEGTVSSASVQVFREARRLLETAPQAAK
jgi:hypothetical protein